MQMWEYYHLENVWNPQTGKWYITDGNQALNMTISDACNQLGAQGWELVSIAATNTGQQVKIQRKSSTLAITTQYIYAFKRPKE